MGMLGRAVRKSVVLPGGQRSGLLHGSCLRHGHPLRRVSYPPEQMREEGRGRPSSAGSAASAGIGARGHAINTERLWREFISDPSQWWDKRLSKKNPNSADFRQKRTRESLWMDDHLNPHWVNPELIAKAVSEAKPDDGFKFQVHRGALGKDRRIPIKEHTGGGRGNSSSTSRGRVREPVISSSLETVPFSKEGGPMNVLQYFDQRGKPVQSSTYVRLLQKCIEVRDLTTGKQIHYHIAQNKVQPDNFLMHTLVNMYTKCGSVVNARQVFDKLLKKNVVSWNSIIGCYAQHGHVKEAYALFGQMRREGLEPNKITYMSILTACARPRALERGKEVHTHIIDSGFPVDVRVGTALVNMYAKCGSIKDARQVFDQMAERDVVSWTALIEGYTQHGQCEEAFEVFRQMQKVGLKPNQITCMSILNACACPTALERGKVVHAHIIDAGFQSDVRVCNALVNMYAKCGSIKDARLAFDKMIMRNVISFNAMIGSYAQHGQFEEAFEIFRQMQQVLLKPDQITYMSILNACSTPAALEKGQEVHAHIIDSGFQCDVRVGTALVNMYAKCGSLKDARLVSDELSK